MNNCKYKTYDELPLMLNAQNLTEVLGISIASAYELMHEKDFPSFRVGSRMFVNREKFIAWVDEKSGEKR
ncbi:MAG: helix-turn-helix domain-containing protein [Clostridia bacterium]|nr:helix-turn-helix domain-containing protein [Clostridia bacterium]